MNKTTIEWVKNPDGSQGYTWNPITGCLNNCSYCYAKKLAYGRLKSRYLANKNIMPVYAEGMVPYNTANLMFSLFPFYPRFWENRLWDLPVEPHAKPRGIFVCDMSDLFGMGIPEEWTKKVLSRMWWGEQHRYYLLTNQPQNLVKFSPFPDNCWVGATATNKSSLEKVIHEMMYVEAKVKFLSIEPLLENIGKSYTQPLVELWSFDWVIIGAQTKPYKPPEVEWVEQIIKVCDREKVPVFLKNNLRLWFRQQIPRV